MAWRRELPHSFEDALKVAKLILSSNHELLKRGTVETEAEQIVIAACRAASGVPMSRAELFTRVKDRFPEKAAERVLVMASSRAEGKPLQYLIGYQQFLDHEYEVGPGVLVPRPETELLVRRATETMQVYKPQAKLGIEIGLGSGILSIELLLQFPELRMVASELSAQALQYARRNAERILGAEAVRLTIVETSGPMEILAAFRGAVGDEPVADFIISNPPYVAASDPIDADVLAHEPHDALFAPEGDLLFFYREVAVRGRHILKPGGFAFMELPESRAQRVLALFEEEGWDAEVFADLAQRDRVLVAQMG